MLYVVRCGGCLAHTPPPPHPSLKHVHPLSIPQADSSNNRVRSIVAATGATTTLAGSSQGVNDGLGAGATFTLPSGLTVDATGSLYVFDNSLRVRKVRTPDGWTVSLAGGGGGTNVGFANGVGTMASFTLMYGLAWDPTTGGIVASDLSNSRIRGISAAGVVSTMAGNGTAGTVMPVAAADALAVLSFPRGVGLDASSGRVFFTDAGANTLRTFASCALASSSQTPSPSLSAGASASSTPTPTPSPTPAASAGGCVVSTLVGSPTGGSGAADGAGPAATLTGPSGVALNPAGTLLYFSDATGNRVRVVTLATATTSLVAGPASGTNAGFVNGFGTSVMWSGPAGLAVDAAGNVFVVRQGCCAWGATS